MTTKLDVTTPSKREIRLTRSFAAPRDLVFDCHTDPGLVKKWLLGPPGWSMPVCEIDLRAGGRYRYVWRNDDNGTEFGVQGIYREVAAPERVITLETMDGVPGELLCTTTFVQAGDVTLMTITLQFDTEEQRNGALESGMIDGMSMSYDRLIGVLNEYASAAG